MKLPKLTKKAILWVDETPDEGYPLRILRAYRQNCDCMWSDNTSGEESSNPIFKLMNEHQRKRADILDKAIKALLVNGKE